MSGDTLRPPPPSPSPSPSKTCHQHREWHGPPPPAELTDGASSLRLLSQGAEARVWLVTLPAPPESKDDEGDEDGGGPRTRSVHVGSGIHVPQLLSLSQRPSPLSPQTQAPGTTGTAEEATTPPLKLICKERFPKKYRHPRLDASLTRSRTKGEARSLIRCRRADVPCASVLAVAHWSNGPRGGGVDRGGTDGDGAGPSSTASSCLFLEYVEGCTVRRYFERRSGAEPNDKTPEGANGEGPSTKRPRCEGPALDRATNDDFPQPERITTAIDAQTLRVAHAIGTLVARMHAAGIVHGDLTTSNVMIRNPPWLCDADGGAGASWTPRLVLIDFGLATSTAPHNTNDRSSGGNAKARPHKQQHNAEEKAVDLYVLERAFLSTHPESDPLVEEVWRGYRGYFEGMDGDDVGAGIGERNGGNGGGGENGNVQFAQAVLNRLEQVRMRGRKRECFG